MNRRFSRDRSYAHALPTNQPNGVALPLGNLRRFLIVKVNGMGDAVMIRSIIEHLRRRRPEIEIGVLVGRATSEVMSSGADFRVHEFGGFKALFALLRMLLAIRGCRYHAILNFEQDFPRLNLALMSVGAPVRLGFAPAGDPSKTAFLTRWMRFQPEHSMWQSFLALAQLIEPQISDVLSTLPLRCSAQAEASVADWWTSSLAGRRPVVAIHPGSYYMEYKRWPLERFIQLAELLRVEAPDLAIVLTGTPPERPLIREFIARYSGFAVDASVLGSVDKVAPVLRRCDLLVSNDTGVMHLGAAMATPTVGLFGPVSPTQWGPVGPRVATVYQTSVPCSPCVNTYAGVRPLECFNPDKTRCMRDIEVSSVVSAARSVIAGNWLGPRAREASGGFPQLVARSGLSS
jgi:heptosyltransferase-2